MHLVAKEPSPQRCPRCGGPMFRDYDDDRCDLLCLLCGEYVFTISPRERIAERRRRAAAAGRALREPGGLPRQRSSA